MQSIQLTPENLVSAYAQGIFPMDVDGRIRWFLPDPRAIVPLDRFHASKTLMRTCRGGRFELRMDTAFVDVMRHCADRPEGSWISDEIVEAYAELHRYGFAHSVETWRAGTLVGGLYGVALRGAFFGESMFHRQRDASKVAFVALVSRLRERGYRLLDVQFSTPHLRGFGAIEVSCDSYLAQLARAMRVDCSWADQSELTERPGP